VCCVFRCVTRTEACSRFAKISNIKWMSDLMILSKKCFETKDILYYANVCIQNRSILQGHLELAFSVLYII
jgi:hypothetical protein